MTRITPEADGIVSVELADPSGAPLPPWEPGAHLDVQLITRQQRQYSLLDSDPRTYRIAVLREERSRGASMYVHEFLRVGSIVRVLPPRNLFPQPAADEHLLLAAGIGITALLPMAQRLHRDGAEWALHYAVRGDSAVPFRSELAALGARVSLHPPARRLDIPALLADPRPGVAVSACGPARFLDAVTAAMAAWPPGSLHLERFEPKPVAARPDAPFSVHCARSDLDVEVPADRTMLQALAARDLPVTGSCLRGVCGSCAVRVLSGEVEHRDSLTTPESTVLYPCVSRAAGARLVVDL
ncbi:2Fe-2S iron-sulfur cluster binding domain-containing protein [Rathayibacter sp. VKM Ac-2803]|uniref:PDR/VanB family oxidoreductase n=1 Tax=Rathayibacter sp. VKM Ac-2803 TaxID=2609256 RepID=UPI00135B0E2E|nr:PDR/VanB family oxidoreductase [Rathayibacter sp. VKM Ac-2803]MWV48944.1 2Fe-2S iron-sulfur cluster binding domain-containing protein [Rathayibacter sp. VKM Ac-2803]